MSSRKTAGRRATTKKRAQRATSNVFAMFDQAQIAEFKEAFNMIDHNHDGFIDKEDLHDMLASLGLYFFSVVLKILSLSLMTTLKLATLEGSEKYFVFIDALFNFLNRSKFWSRWTFRVAKIDCLKKNRISLHSNDANFNVIC